MGSLPMFHYASCNENRDLVKNVSLAFYTIYNDMMSMKV